MITPTRETDSTFSVRFGTEHRSGFAIGIPILAGPGAESLFADAVPLGTKEGFVLFRAGGWLLGHAAAPAGDDIESVAFDTYRRLLAVNRGYNPVRIWNYVPRINQPRPDRLEIYRAFSSGRASAFEQEWGPQFKGRVPSASAVGTDADRFCVVFASSADTPIHFENPSQTPAYEYPRIYGPRPPSFARATSLKQRSGLADVFISGTAAIRGHVTIAPGNTEQQIPCTIENLRTIGQRCGLGADLAAGRASSRHVKVYLRHERDLELTMTALQRDLLAPGDNVSYLRADICRPDLNVEIEVSVFGVAP